MDKNEYMLAVLAHLTEPSWNLTTSVSYRSPLDAKEARNSVSLVFAQIKSGFREYKRTGHLILYG